MKYLFVLKVEFWSPKEIYTFLSWIIHFDRNYKVFRLFGLTFQITKDECNECMEEVSQ